MAPHSLGWFQWVCDTFEIQPDYKWDEERVEGAVYKGDLVNYAAFQGSVEISRWLMEKKGCKLNGGTCWYAGMGGSVEVLEYLLRKGLKLKVETCQGAARGGCLEALKFLRSQDPPCPWDEMTSTFAAKGGHLEVLKWAFSQDPPCPWYGMICGAAASGGQLQVLKWLRSHDPPCSWSRCSCRWEASILGHTHVVEWIDQQEDHEGDV